MTYLEFGEKKTEMDETENTVAEILDDLINSALDKIFQGRNLPIFGRKIIILRMVQIRAILVLKSMSERVGTDKERLSI